MILRRFRLGASLSLKLMLSVVAVVTVAGALIAGKLGREARSQLIDAKVTAASMLCELLAETLAPAVDFGDIDSVTAELQHLKLNRDITYVAVWGRGGDTPMTQVHASSHQRGRPAPGAQLDVHADHIAVVRDLRDPRGEAIGTIVAEFSLAAENARTNSTRRQIFLFTGVLSLGVSLVVFGVMRAQVIRPMSRLVDAAEELGSGSLQTVPITSEDELGKLGTAFNAMANAIHDREKSLAIRNFELRQLLDNLREAIVVFGADGTLEGFRSHQAQAVFSSGDLDDRTVLSLLYPDAMDGVEAAAFSAWQSAAFEATSASWSETLELAPQKVTLREGREDERILSLEFIPLFDGDAVKQIMLLATDLTDQQRLERMVKRQDEEHSRKLAAMRRLLAGGGHLLVAMLDSSQGRAARCMEWIEGDSLDLGTLEAVFRQIHTIKGEARAFDLGELEAAATLLEDYLVLLRSRLQRQEKPPDGEDLAVVRERLRGVDHAIGAARSLLVEASPIGSAIVEQVTVRRSDLDRVVRLLGDGNDEQGEAVRKLAARPFGESLLYLTEAVPSWAQRYGKQVLLEVIGRDVRIPLGLAALLPPVMTHLARNAVAHGIETTLEREAAGKPARGRIEVIAKEAYEGVQITFSDDGRGLDLQKIAEQAARLGLSGTPEELVFAPGLSTSDETLLSGRGVGLGAARQELSRAGYRIELRAGEVGTIFRIFSVGKVS